MDKRSKCWTKTPAFSTRVRTEAGSLPHLTQALLVKNVLAGQLVGTNQSYSPQDTVPASRPTRTPMHWGAGRREGRDGRIFTISVLRNSSLYWRYFPVSLPYPSWDVKWQQSNKDVGPRQARAQLVSEGVLTTVTAEQGGLFSCLVSFSVGHSLDSLGADGPSAWCTLLLREMNLHLGHFKIRTWRRC